MDAMTATRTDSIDGAVASPRDLPPSSVLDTPVSVAGDGTALVSITFSAHAWRELSYVEEVTPHLRGCRVVGVVACRPAGRALASGVLMRHIPTRTYRLAGTFGLLALQTEPTEAFLVHHRQGHHGGPGRCQGTLTQDGYSYTRSIGLTLPDQDIAWLLRYGAGNLSMGIRRAASVAAQRLLVDDATLLHSMDDPSPPVPGTRKSRVRAYLDADSLRRLDTVGAGNTSAGVRIVIAYLTRQPAA